MIIVLFSIATAIAITALYRLCAIQLQLTHLTSVLRKSIESETEHLSYFSCNPALRSIFLFVRELLQRNREMSIAKEKYSQRGFEGSVYDGSRPLEDLPAILAETLLRIDNVACCWLLSGSVNKLQQNCFSSKLNIPKSKLEGLILSIVEKELPSLIAGMKSFILLPIHKWQPQRDFFAITGLQTIGIGINVEGATINVLCIGIRQGKSTINTAEEDYLKELCSNTLRTLQLLRGVNKLLVNEQENLIGISHDLRTPGVTAMYVLNDILENRDQAISGDTLSKIKLIERCLKDQLNGISEFIREKKVSCPRHPQKSVNLFDLCNEIINLHEYCAKSHNANFNLTCARDLSVICSEHVLRRILSNLISNSSKYSAPGVIDVTLEGIADGINIRVTNPIAPKNQDGNSVVSLGIGIQVVQKLVESVRGQFVFKKNCGTNGEKVEVTVSLPCTFPTKAKSYKRVLVIDDNEITARMHVRFVQELGCPVDCAMSIEEAVELFRSRKYDIVISDLFLRGSKLGTVEMLYGLPHETKIVIVSGAIGSKSLPIGGRKITYLAKPITRDQLIHEIRLMTF